MENHVCVEVTFLCFIQKNSTCAVSGDDWSEKPGDILLLYQAPSSIEYCEYCDITGVQKTSHVVFKSNGGDLQLKYFWQIDISDVHKMKKLVHQLYLLGKDSQIAAQTPPRKSLMICCMHGSRERW